MTPPIRPWQKLPYVSCYCCPAQATYRAAAASLVPDDRYEGDGIALTFTDEPERASLLACDEHFEQAMQSVRETSDADGSIGGPLRLPWRCWFLYYSTTGRPIGDFAVKLSNWRFERWSARADDSLIAQKTSGSGGT